MNRGRTNYVVDVFLLLAAVVLGVSSLLLWIIFPHGYFPSRLLWLEIHKWSGLSLYVAAAVHIGLHARWLARMTMKQLSAVRRIAARRRRPPRTGRDVSGETQRPVVEGGET